MEIFFRNDDVNTLTQELIVLMEIFELHNIPITMAVEPANITKETVEWLKIKKLQNPEKICIIQHGYDHQDRIPGKGEFGGRSYEDQFIDIKKGKELMEKYFGDMFFPAFTCPRGYHNNATIKCMNHLGFKVFSSGHGIHLKHRILYYIGKKLQRTHLLGKHISYHTEKIPYTNLWEFSMSMSLIKHYFSKESCEFYTLSELKKLYQLSAKRTNVIGITLHHRYHKKKEDMDLVTSIIQYLKDQNCNFVTLEGLYRKYCNYA